MTQAKYIMIGGFLGAGKTTAILRLAAHLKAQGLRVGLITNDQARGLVDTARAKADHWPVEEIAGGCFCCRFDSLVEASRRLAEAARPDVFIAEPVGSCTDLSATILQPVKDKYPEIDLAPLTVLADPQRVREVLQEEDSRLHASALYILRPNDVPAGEDPSCYYSRGIAVHK